MFKKLTAFILSAVILFSGIALAFNAGAVYEDPGYLLGDVDLNGVLNLEDARLALRYHSGISKTLASQQFERADVDGNGKIEFSDVYTIFRATVGLEMLQPTGAFDGFETNAPDIIGTPEQLIDIFNYAVNKIKTEDGFAAGFSRYATDTLKTLDIKEMEIIGFNLSAGTDFVTEKVVGILTNDDENGAESIVSKGDTDMSKMSVENSVDVSTLTAADLYGARANIDPQNKTVTLEIALPDVEMDTVYNMDCPYNKVLNPAIMMEKAESTFTKLVGSGATNVTKHRMFKNLVVKAVISYGYDALTGSNYYRIKEYSTSYDTFVYFSEAKLIGIAKIKNTTYEKNRLVEYKNFTW